MIWRVSVGAALSMLDAATDIYVITKYYNTDGLQGQANAMLAMLATNMGIQIIFVMFQYKKKSWKVKAKEALICLFFLRPAVDAYRVSANIENDESICSPMQEMIMNKVRTLSKCGRKGKRSEMSTNTKNLLFLSLLNLRLSRSLVACCSASF